MICICIHTHIYTAYAQGNVEIKEDQVIREIILIQELTV